MIHVCMIKGILEWVGALLCEIKIKWLEEAIELVYSSI